MELLAPGGDFHKLKTALSYGADSVYVGAYAFGLRSSAGNFSLEELEEAIRYTHRQKKKIYLAVNTFPTHEEIGEMQSFFSQLRNLDLDALIIADSGVFSLAREILPSIPVHFSTQASICNGESVRFWKKNGVSRIILAREVTIQEARSIKQESGSEIEMFIHGSMCMAYSGKCTISNYTAGRDANRGGCVNSCRWDYSLLTAVPKKRTESSSSSENSFNSFDSLELLEKPLANIGNSYPMNSRDLWAVDSIVEMGEAGVDCLKIEGRMKSHLYLATTTRIYRTIIDRFLEEKLKRKAETSQTHLSQTRWNWEGEKKELESLPNRGFSEASLQNRAGKESILYDNSKQGRSKYLGIFREILDEWAVVQVKNPFSLGDELSILPFRGEPIFHRVQEIKNLDREKLSSARPNSLVLLSRDPRFSVNQVLSFRT